MPRPTSSHYYTTTRDESTALPPMGAAKEHATPTAHAAANISEFRDSFS